MLDALLRMLTELGPMAAWTAIFVASIVATFVLYIGIALLAVLRASEQQPELRYWAFRDLLDLFRRKSRKQQ